LATIGSLSAGTSTAVCPIGWTITGGGFETNGVTVEDSRQGPQLIPTGSDNSWYVLGSTPVFGGGTVRAWATCARIAP